MHEGIQEWLFIAFLMICFSWELGHIMVFAPSEHSAQITRQVKKCTTPLDIPNWFASSQIINALLPK